MSACRRQCGSASQQLSPQRFADSLRIIARFAAPHRLRSPRFWCHGAREVTPHLVSAKERLPLVSGASFPESLGDFPGRPAGGFGNKSNNLFAADFTPQGAAGLFSAWEAPETREIPALLRLHRLYGAGVALQEDTFALGFLLKCEAATVGAQASVSLDEVELGELEERCEA